MANVKIPDLAALAAPALVDLFIIHDADADETKYLEAQNYMKILNLLTALAAAPAAADVIPIYDDDAGVCKKITLAHLMSSTMPSGTIMLFGQNAAPTGWTRYAAWQDNAMLCYASAGNIGNGGAVNPQSVHLHSYPNHTHVINTDESVQNFAADLNKPVIFVAGYFYHSDLAGGAKAQVLTNDTDTDGGGNTGNSTAPHYQEVIAATKD